MPFSDISEPFLLLRCSLVVNIMHLLFVLLRKT